MAFDTEITNVADELDLTSEAEGGAAAQRRGKRKEKRNSKQRAIVIAKACSHDICLLKKFIREKSDKDTFNSWMKDKKEKIQTAPLFSGMDASTIEAITKDAVLHRGDYGNVAGTIKKKAQAAIRAAREDGAGDDVDLREAYNCFLDDYANFLDDYSKFMGSDFMGGSAFMGSNTEGDPTENTVVESPETEAKKEEVKQDDSRLPVARGSVVSASLAVAGILLLGGLLLGMPKNWK